MKRYKWIAGLLIFMFAWTEVAYAASISTRVRILESKVSKFDHKIRAESAARQAYEKKVNQKLSTVDDLEVKVRQIVKSMDKKKKGKQDKRYAFP